MKESEFQVELNDLRARSKQRIMVNRPETIIIPPALFTNEMLDQIRAVVREELQTVTLREMRWEEIERLEAHLKSKKCRICGKIPLEALLPAVIFAGMDDYLVKYPLCRCDTSTDEQEAFLKGQRKAI